MDIQSISTTAKPNDREVSISHAQPSPTMSSALVATSSNDFTTIAIPAAGSSTEPIDLTGDDDEATNTAIPNPFSLQPLAQMNRTRRRGRAIKNLTVGTSIQNMNTSSRATCGTKLGVPRSGGLNIAEAIDLTGADDFTLFPKLPVEIRLKIWKFARPDPRFILISRHGYRPWELGEEEVEDLVWCASSTPPPVLLSVCRESRGETLRSYKILNCRIGHDDTVHLRTKTEFERRYSRECFPTQRQYLFQFSYRPGMRPTPVYCDFGRDIICVELGHRHNFLDQLAEEDRNNLAHLAVATRFLNAQTLPVDIKKLPGLRKLMLGKNLWYISHLYKWEKDQIWKMCKGFGDDPNLNRFYPNLDKQAEQIVQSHKNKYPKSELVAMAGRFVDRNNIELKSWQGMFGTQWEPGLDCTSTADTHGRHNLLAYFW